MEHIACEMAANIGVLSCANTLLRCKLMYQFIETLVNFRRWAVQEDALSSADRLIDSHSLHTPCDSEYVAKRKAYEAEKLDELLICLIALKRAGEEFRYVSPDEVLPIAAIPLAQRMFRLTVPLELEEKFQEFENRLFNEPRYLEIAKGMEKVLNLGDKKEAAIYEKFIRSITTPFTASGQMHVLNDRNSTRKFMLNSQQMPGPQPKILLIGYLQSGINRSELSAPSGCM